MSILTRLVSVVKPIDANTVGVPQLDGSAVFLGILNTVYVVAGITAVIVIIIAGFMFVGGGSNPATVTKARSAILYAVIGIVVILSAFTLTQFVIGRV